MDAVPFIFEINSHPLFVEAQLAIFAASLKVSD
jgi:hypothetical protein